MRLILIESTLYKVTEQQFKKIIKKQKEIDSKEYYHGSDVEMDDFLNDLKKQKGFKEMGPIEFDFRL